MFGPKSNIYVSLKTSHDYVKSTDGKPIMRARNIWMLSIQPQKHRFSTTNKLAESRHFTARYDETWQEYALQSVAAINLEMAGSIEIGHNVEASSELVIEHLRAKLANAPSPPTGMTAPAGSEHWIQVALHALMNDKIIESFDVEDFLTFARSYLNQRLGQGAGAVAPAVVSYAKLQKDFVKKPKSQGIWLTYPMATSNRTGDRIYGGLM